MSNTITMGDDTGRTCRFPKAVREAVWAAFVADRPAEAAILAGGDNTDGGDALGEAVEAWVMWTNALLTATLDTMPE